MTTASDSHTQERKRQHDAARVRMLYQLVPRSVAITLLVSALAGWVIRDEVNHAVLATWLVAVALVSGLRFGLYMWHRNTQSADAEPILWENAATLGAALMGSCWGALAWLGPLSASSEVFTVFVLGGMSLGSAGILGASLRAFICFNAPILISQIGELFYLGGTLYSTMGAMALMFTAGLVSSYREFRSALLASINAQIEIENTNRQQRLIFESVTAGVAFVRDRTIIDCNPQFARMLGYADGELSGQPTRVYYVDDAMWQRVGNEGYALLRRGEVMHEEYAFRTKSGGTITCDATMQSMIPGQPEQGIVVILNDITLLKEREYALREALLRQLAIFGNAPAGIILTRDRIVEECNEHMADMLGAALEEVVGRTAEHWFVSSARWAARGQEIYAAFSRGESYEYSEQFVRNDGSRFWCRVRGGAIDAANPVHGPAVFVLVDVTDQILAEAALREGREQMALVIRAAQSGIWDSNLVTQEISFSERFYEILGLPPDTPASRITPIMDLVHPDDRKRVKSVFYKHVAHRVAIDEAFRMAHASGLWIWVRGQGQAQWDARGKATRFVGSITDITEKRRQEEEIRRLALEDPLTGLPNRRLLEDRLERALSTAARNSEQVAVLLLDLDGFKEVNDEYGHAAGDALLKTVAGRLKSMVRDSDTVARTGGDEFVFIVRGIRHVDDTRRLAHKLLASISAPINVEGNLLRVGASIGIALYPDNSLHPAQLVRLADAAMYQVKQSGRNGYRLAEHTDVPLTRN